MEPKKETYDYIIKALLLGDSNVGKTLLIGKFIDNEFSENTLNTIGLDLQCTSLVINKKKINLQIWDTAGQEKYKSMTTSYYRGVNIIFIVYDVTNQESFNHVKNWIADIDKFAKINVMKVLVGNKIDLIDKRVISKEEGINLSKKYKIKFFETSAMLGEGVKEMFETICIDYTKNHEQRTINNYNLKLQNFPGEKKNCKC